MMNLQFKTHVALLGMAMLALAGIARADAVAAKVIALADADVLTVQREGAATAEDVRLYGVDCPDAGQPFAEEAKKYVSEKVLNQSVTVEILTKDNQGKDVGLVTLPDNEKLHRVLLQAGMAWYDSENAKDEPELRSLCAAAIVAQAGLWKDPAALSPWDYRRSKGLPAITYSVKPVEAPKEAAKEEPKVLSAKGNEVYKGGFSVNVADIKFDQELNPQDLIMQHTPTVARNDAGAPIGLSVPNIGTIPYAGQLGFREGDVITGVNGDPITDMSQVYGLYEKYKGSKQLNVGIIRGGQPTNIRINLP